MKPTRDVPERKEVRTIRLEPELIPLIDNIAKENRISFSNVVRAAIKKYVTQYLKEAARKTRRQ